MDGWTHRLRLPTLRDPRGAWMTFAAIFYVVGGIACSLYCYLHTGDLSAAALGGAVLLAAHSRSIAAWLVHEFAHSTLFLESEWNTAAGVAMMWLCGCPYVDFVHCKRIHIAHHKDRADTGSFDHQEDLRKLRAPLLNAVYALEYFYVPVVECLVHARVALCPLGLYPLARRDPSTPMRITLTAFAGVIALLALWSHLWIAGGVRAVALRAVEACLMTHFHAIHDCFQHTYEVIADENWGTMYAHGPGERTAAYEEENTYSNLLSTRWPLLNLASLNFGYHNAHHARMMTPWYELPNLHARLYGVQQYSNRQVLPIRELLWSWHAHRLKRILHPDYGSVGNGPGRAKSFIGAMGVSFITA